MKKILLTITLALISIQTQAMKLQSEIVNIRASHLKERIVLVSKPEKGLTIQVAEEFIQSATDVSNTSRIVFSISQTGEMGDTNASFVVTGSMQLVSAERVSGGIYKIVYKDADLFPNTLTSKTINAIEAVNSVQQATTCSEFSTCDVNTSIDVN